MNRKQYDKVMVRISNGVTLVGECVAEYAACKVAESILSKFLPAGMKLFPKLLIKVGTSLIYEATIGSKVVEYLSGACELGSKIGGNASEALGLLDVDEPIDEIEESEPEQEVEA